MLQMVVSGVKLHEKMDINKNERKPVVHFSDHFTIDDSILEKPTMLMGQVGSGKSYIMKNILMPQIFAGMNSGDAAVIFATKREMVDGFYYPEKGDILFEYKATEPHNIWNIFAEMEASDDPEKTLTELCDVMFFKHKNTIQPFFTNAPKDMLKAFVMYLYHNYECQMGKKPTNGTLIGFINTLTLKDTVVNGRKQRGLLTLIKEEPELHHLADYLGDGGTAQALGVLGEFRSVINMTFQGGAFVKGGTFSVREAIRNGRKVFLLYNFSESTESSMAFFDMILDQLIKLSLQENQQNVWFILDEFSMIGHLQYLESALAFGRGNGFRIVAAIQSMQLMEKNYTKDAANCILGLFPNIVCFFTSDDKSREMVSNRYGYNMVSITGLGGGKPELMERKAILDSDFHKITKPGDCIVSLAGYEPFIFRNHKE